MEWREGERETESGEREREREEERESGRECVCGEERRGGGGVRDGRRGSGGMPQVMLTKTHKIWGRCDM